MVKKGTTPAASRHELDAFDRQLELALEHFADPAWLGQYSPLAAPYFLGQALESLPAWPGTARDRGERFCALLRQCADALETELRTLLQLTYFARNVSHDNVALALALNLSDRTFYRARILAIKALARSVQDRVAPPVRMEQPAAAHLVGRADAAARLLALLEAGGSVYLSGPSGVGKSTLAAAVAEQWQAVPGRRAFWFTLRDRSNDHVASLLFVLGWFLHSAGAGNTWRQLVADRAVIDLERILSLLRFDLESLPGRSLLFCIDDADVLGHEQMGHVQILHVLEVLRARAPLLLIGQRLVLESDEAIVLAGLHGDAAAALLVSAGAPPLPPETLGEIVVATRGLPALLRLMGALLAAGDDPATALAELGRAPALEALFHRIWRRMEDGERALALQLAVFRTPTPQDAWHAQEDALARLRARGLLVDDRLGGLALLPHLRALFFDRIPAEQRPALHARAADVRAARAEYTRAVEHAIAARQPERAVWLWFANRQREIDRGQGTLALQLLHEISLADLPDARDRNALQLARSELFLLAGRAEDAREALRSIAEREGRTELAAYVRLVTAQAEEMAGQIEQAIGSYRSAIDQYVGLAAQHEVLAHLRLSFLSMYRQHEVESARREALLAHIKADAFLGELEVMAGRFENALAMLRAAEADLDRHGEDLVTRSRLCIYQSSVYLRLGQLDAALASLDRAIECDRKRGDEVTPLYARLNRAWALKEMGRLVESEQEAREALRAAERLRNAYLVAGLAAGVAEACWAQEKWEEAERFTVYSLQQEEVFFRAAACVVLAAVRMHQGRRAEANQLFAAAVEHTQQIGDRENEAYVWRERGRAAQQAGDDEEAGRSLARAEQLYTELGLAHEVAALRQLYGTGVH